MKESLDLRKFPRLTLKCDVEIQEAKHSLRFATTTQNIGAGGICVILPRELAKLTQVLIRLHLTDDLPPVECHAKVCWVVRSRFLFKNEDHYDTGLEFLDIKDNERQRVKQLIEKHWPR